MNSIVRTLCLLLLFSTSSLYGGGPDPDMTWGEVPVDQLKMTAFPSDSNATAVILFDFGDVTFNQNYELMFTHHRRVKILSQAGYTWGTYTIPYYAKDKTQRITDLEGQTITIDPAGKVSTKELDDDAIFDEESGEGWKRTKFTLPSLTPGCIVEFRYTMKSINPLYMPDWYFQNPEPTLWSEFRMKTPIVFIYSGVANEPFPFFIKTNEMIKETFLITTGAAIIEMNSARYVVKDMPAIREEPYMTTLDDYRQRVTLQLSMISWPGESSRHFLESWEKLARELSDHPRIGGQLKGFGAVRRQTDEIVRSIKDTLQQLEAIHKFVANTIVWNGRNRAFTSGDLDDILEHKNGNSADINFLLTLMLQSAGIEAYPVLLSTRGHGVIQSLYPIVDQFDYVVTKAVVGKRTFFMDATDRFRRYDLLPTRALNHTGFLLKQGKYEWTTIEPAGRGRHETVIDAVLSPEGAIRARAELRFAEYGAARQLEQYSGKKRDDYIKDLFSTETSGLAADSFQVDQSDSLSSRFIVRANLTAPAYAQTLNDFIYFNPFLTDRTRENPFKLEKRTFLVDFAYPLSTSYTATITLPDGYVVKDPPGELTLRLPANGGSYRRTVNTAGNRVTVVEQFEINQIVFQPKQYPGLRSFYEQIVAAENEQLIAEKRTPIPLPDPPAPIKQNSKGKK